MRKNQRGIATIEIFQQQWVLRKKFLWQSHKEKVSQQPFPQWCKHQRSRYKNKEAGSQRSCIFSLVFTGDSKLDPQRSWASIGICGPILIKSH
jgi:hypothetical protein